LTVALERLKKLLGPPASPIKRSPMVVEQALAQAALYAGMGFALDIRALVPALVDDPKFRLSGAEEMLRQFLITTDRLIERFFQAASEQDVKAQTGFECVSQFAHFQKGMRKPSVAGFAEALRQYPRSRFQALTFRHLVGIYKTVRDALASHMTELSSARQRLEAASQLASSSPEAIEIPAGNRRLMPPGCFTVADAV